MGRRRADGSRVGAARSLPSGRRWKTPRHRDQMDTTHYPTRNVSDTGWEQRYWMDTAMDAIAGEFVMALQGHPHGLGSRLPQTRRPLECLREGCA
jgi:hypothetical protein